MRSNPCISYGVKIPFDANRIIKKTLIFSVFCLLGEERYLHKYQKGASDVVI
jgi:hypothetical protein